MKILADSSPSLGDIAIDVATYKAVAAAGHHLEVITSQACGDVLIDCDFIARLHLRGSSWRSKLCAAWIASRQPWDIMISTRFFPSRYKPLDLLARADRRFNRKDMDESLFEKGAVMYRLSILRNFVADWDKNIDTTIPFRPERLQAALAVAGLQKGSAYITVAPGSSKQVKIWDKRNFVELINKLRTSLLPAVAVVGSPAESAVCEEIAHATSSTSVAGRMGLSECCALVSGARLHVGNDSGLGHVAAGNGVATLAIGGDCDMHHCPWQQHMLAGRVGDISVAKVLDAIDKITGR